MSITVYTVGHSTHTAGAFIRLLRLHKVSVLADARSVPYSRYNPQFNRESLAESVQAAGLEYLYLGDMLGGRVSGDRFSGYAALRRTTSFKEGLAALVNVAASSTTAMMCAEQDPIGCHRAFLVSQALEQRRVHVEHILSSGQLESHYSLINRLLKCYGMDDRAEAGKLFQRPRHERVETALQLYLAS